MSQDTRKDKRAKVVSLNVRYKSATVDEFIENHSHDVSKGGIFVKTPTPFPPGTLLKFEIRLAGDKSVISGVGRVVWKREPTQATADKPAGMGVKFIKIDDASRAVIDRLVALKADAGSAYTSDPAALEDEAARASGLTTTLRGIPAAHPIEAPASTPAPAAALATPVPDITAGAVATATGPAAAVAPGAAALAPAPTPGPSTLAPSKGLVAPSSSPPSPSSPPSLTKTANSPRPAGVGVPVAKTMPLGSVSPNLSPPGQKPATGAGTPAARGGGPPPPIAHKPATTIGMGPPLNLGATPAPTSLSAAASPPPSPSPPPPRSEPRVAAPAPRSPGNMRKATMLGVGLPVPSAASSIDNNDLPTLSSDFPPAPFPTGLSLEASEPAAPPKPKASAPMFPTLDDDPAPYDSVKEPTVMKQAAELLEEALREAGGSLDEIGQNPLFSQTSQRNDKVVEQKSDEAVQSDPFANTLLIAPLGNHGPGVSSNAPLSNAPSPSSVPPRVATSSSKPTPFVVKSTPPPSNTEALKPIGDSLGWAPEKKKGGGGLIAALLVVAVLGGGGVYAYKSGALAGVIGGGPTASPTPAPTPTPTPSASDSANLAAPDAAPTAEDGSAALAATTGDAAASAASADASASATTDASAPGVAVGATATTTPKPQPTYVKPKPKPAPTPTDTDQGPAPEPTATSTTTATPTATATAIPTATAAPTTTAEP